MKPKIFPILGAVVVGLVIVGCVSTVNDRKQTGMPFVRDQLVGRYERPVSEIFVAATAVISQQGTLLRESTLFQTNLVKVAEGMVNQRHVWVRVEEVDPKISEVTVQVRTKGGNTDVELTHQIEKEIALKLVR